MTKLIVAFRNFVNAPQICRYFSTNIRAARRRLGPTDLFFQLWSLIGRSFVKILGRAAFWTTPSKARVIVRMCLEMAVQLCSDNWTLKAADYFLTHMVSNVWSLFSTYNAKVFDCSPKLTRLFCEEKYINVWCCTCILSEMHWIYMELNGWVSSQFISPECFLTEIIAFFLISLFCMI